MEHGDHDDSACVPCLGAFGFRLQARRLRPWYRDHVDLNRTCEPDAFRELDALGPLQSEDAPSYTGSTRQRSPAKLYPFWGSPDFQTSAKSDSLDRPPAAACYDVGAYS